MIDETEVIGADLLGDGPCCGVPHENRPHAVDGQPQRLGLGRCAAAGARCGCWMPLLRRGAGAAAAAAAGLALPLARAAACRRGLPRRAGGSGRVRALDGEGGGHLLAERAERMRQIGQRQTGRRQTTRQGRDADRPGWQSGMARAETQTDIARGSHLLAVQQLALRPLLRCPQCMLRVPKLVFSVGQAVQCVHEPGDRAGRVPCSGGGAALQGRGGPDQQRWLAPAVGHDRRRAGLWVVAACRPCGDEGAQPVCVPPGRKGGLLRRNPGTQQTRKQSRKLPVASDCPQNDLRILSNAKRSDFRSQDQLPKLENEKDQLSYYY